MSKNKNKKDVVFTGMLCLSNIVEERVTHSENTGKDWIKIGVILLAKPDRYGNNLMVQHRGDRGQKHTLIGNAVKRGEINFEFPHRVPSKIDSRTEREDTYRDFDFDDLP